MTRSTLKESTFPSQEEPFRKIRRKEKMRKHQKHLKSSRIRKLRYPEIA